MSTTALALSKPALTQDVWGMIQAIAPVMHQGRLFGTKSVEGAMGIMIKGWELGFSLSASFENLVEIEGKIALIPKGALAKIHSSPELAGIKITDEVDPNGVPLACTVWMKRKNGFEYTARFSMDDAKRADLIKPKSGWEKYPANMMRWRAIGFCADVVFPDVIGGTKRADELGADLTPDGDVIEGSWTQVGSQQSQGAVANPGHSTGLYSGHPGESVSQKPAISLSDLTAKYEPAEIMAANEGKIPASNEEIAAVAEKLGYGNE